MRAALVCLGLGLAGCTTYRDQLARADSAFEAKDNDKTIALLRNIEVDFQRLSPTEQADYAYTRGMADYDVGYRQDARHWLAVAKACDDRTPGALAEDRKPKVASALAELNKVVFDNDGIAALTNTRAPAPPKDAEAKPGPAKDAKKPAAKPAAKPKADDTAPDDD